MFFANLFLFQGLKFSAQQNAYSRVEAKKSSVVQRRFFCSEKLCLEEKTFSFLEVTGAEFGLDDKYHSVRSEKISRDGDPFFVQSRKGVVAFDSFVSGKKDSSE